MSRSPLNLPRLAWRYLWARPMLTALNLMLLSLGLAAIGFVVLVSEQLEHGVKRDLAGIDLVVGAKGSPMQILLAGVFHLDQSTGNIPLATVRQLRQQPLVAEAVPISLGDSFRGFRIVGTTAGYLSLYELKLAQGQGWTVPMQAVIGAEVARRSGLKPGDRFHGTHGLASGGDEHEGAYEVTGVLAPTGGVADRLVLTDLASVWEAHAAHGHAARTTGQDPGQAAAGGDPAARGATDAHDAHDADGTRDGHDGHGSHEAHDARGAIGAQRPARPRDGDPAQAQAQAQAEAALEVSMVLVRYRSPLGAVMLPRWVNAQPGLQASVPALETARLLSMLGVGVEVLRGFGLVLLLAAALSVLVALLHAVRERQGDLAMLRMLGATPARVAGLIALEALMLAALATLLALGLAHALTAGLGAMLAAQQSVQVSGLWWSAWEALVPALALGLALIAAAWPAWRGYRLDVTELLQTPR
ncbi:multidrug ABC transporter substrate-binding protein [Roseateles aquatilis]|uniref:Multidrug ABC transporter substrate-binding protein n=1 Tax=Roseateles aquatilis TaxID=431061 RepID=A0A246JHT6_9BURK|nr:ABC transporter permease [Roseateles aquatilis]OWQ92171.1 multidrug ABC transporter substrate-binding protein [Roseateles aquatilis]